jgi:phosphoglucosamine mutase
MMLTLMVETQKPLSALRAMHRVPQVMENVRVVKRVPWTEMPDVQRLIAAAEKRLGTNGRLLVRYSGTEMLARVMIEGEDPAEIGALAREIGSAIGKRVGRAGA